MPARETELFKEKVEVSLDGRQIFYLFFGGAVIASMVFVLGVMVGRRVEARAVADGAEVTSPAIDPLAALDRLEASEAELAFPAALRGGDQALGSVDAELAPTIERITAEEAEAAAAADRPAAVKEPAKPAEKKSAEPAEEDSAPEPAAEKAPPRKASDEDLRRAKFTLQVGSFQSRSEAEAFHQELGGKGYRPYIAEVDLEDKGIWFRVRVGGYDSYDDALAAKSEFEKAQHIIAYVTRLKKK